MIQLATTRNRKLTNDHIRCPYEENSTCFGNMHPPPHKGMNTTPDFYNSKLLAF